MKITETAKSLKLWIPTIFLVMKRDDTPRISKIFALITVSYALSPIDLIPDFIPILGYLDDIILLPILIKITLRLTPDYIIAESKVEAKNIWNSDKPKKWIYSIPIIVIWLVVIALIYKYFIHK